jgi:hypothetical protein
MYKKPNKFLCKFDEISPEIGLKYSLTPYISLNISVIMSHKQLKIVNLTPK